MRREGCSKSEREIVELLYAAQRNATLLWHQKSRFSCHQGRVSVQLRLTVIGQCMGDGILAGSTMFYVRVAGNPPISEGLTRICGYFYPRVLCKWVPASDGYPFAGTRVCEYPCYALCLRDNSTFSLNPNYTSFPIGESPFGTRSYTMSALLSRLRPEETIALLSMMTAGAVYGTLEVG